MTFDEFINKCVSDCVNGPQVSDGVDVEQLLGVYMKSGGRVAVDDELLDLLDDIEEYLEQRADVKDSGDSVVPNDAMGLWQRLRDYRRAKGWGDIDG